MSQETTIVVVKTEVEKVDFENGRPKAAHITKPNPELIKNIDKKITDWLRDNTFDASTRILPRLGMIYVTGDSTVIEAFEKYATTIEGIKSASRSRGFQVSPPDANSRIW